MCDDAWLGSRRLAVQDTTRRGHQPMLDDDSAVAMVFNGEVYNYVELRAELQAAGATFRSGSDTEVVLQAYLHWGERCVERFNGMWAFVIADTRTQCAFFSRDRYGVKPLWITHARGLVSLASEPKALLHLYPELRKPDERTLYDFLALGRLYDGTRSFYEGITAIPPNTTGTFSFGSKQQDMRRFWTFPTPGSGDDASNEELVERFGYLLEDSVRIRMRSDVPVGVSLSGGLDSTAVLHGAAAALVGGQSLTAFTSVFEPTADAVAQDERAWARLARQPYPAIILEEVPAAGADWQAIFERALWHLDGPNYSPAIVPLWSIMEHAHEQGVKVMLEGQGGDELLGGYIQHAALALLGRSRGRSGTRRGVISDFRAYSRAFGAMSFSLWMLRESVPSLRHSYRARLGTASVLDPAFKARYPEASVTRPSSQLGQRLVQDFSQNILPALLHYGDAVSSAHSIEARQPFLDYRLVEFCVGLDDRFKVANGATKQIERRYLHSVGQSAIAARVDKLGFPTPMWQWLVADDASGPRSLLLGSDTMIGAYCNRSALERLIDRTARKPETGAAHLYRLVATELWMRSTLG